MELLGYRHFSAQDLEEEEVNALFHKLESKYMDFF